MKLLQSDLNEKQFSRNLIATFTTMMVKGSYMLFRKDKRFSPFPEQLMIASG